MRVSRNIKKKSAPQTALWILRPSLVPKNLHYPPFEPWASQENFQRELQRCRNWLWSNELYSTRRKTATWKNLSTFTTVTNAMGGEDRDRTHDWELTHFWFCYSSDNSQLFACWSVDWYLMASIKEDCILEVRLMSRKIVIHHQLLPRKKFQWLTQFQVASNCNIPSLAYLLLNSRKDHFSVYFSVTTSF